MAEELLDGELRRVLARLGLAFRRARGAGGEGARRAAGRAGRQEFADYRDYEPGDDLRDLDWAAYARLEKLFIKEYAERSTEPVTLLLDSSASMGCGIPDKWRYARRLALALGYLALLGRHALRVLLLADGQWLGPFDRPEKIEELAARLTGASTRPHDAPGEALRRQQRALLRHGQYLLVSDFWAGDELQQALLAAQGPARRWRLIHLLSGTEIAPPLAGPLRLRDAEGGAPCELQVDRALIEAYHRELEQHLARWAAFGQRYRLPRVQLDTRAPLEAALLGELREGGLVT